MLSRPRRFLLLIFSIILLLFTAAFFYQKIGRLLLPLYAQAMHLLMPDSWHISSLQLTRQGHEEYISVSVETHASLFMAGQCIPAGTGMNGSTLLSHALLPPLIVLSSLFAWLCLSSGRTIGPVMVSLFFLMLIESLDVPIVLVGSLWDILHENINAPCPVPWQARAMDLLNGGGRQALSLAAVFAAISPGSMLHFRFRNGMAENSPHTLPTAQN